MTQNLSDPLGTWEQVVAAFRDSLQMRVCDDQPAVDDSVRRQTPRFTREANSPDPSRSREARLWFKAVTVLRDATRRAAAIEVVYLGFAQLAQVALTAAVGDGSTRQNTGLREALQSLAIDTFWLDEKLADRFVQRLLSSVPVATKTSSDAPLAGEPPFESYVGDQPFVFVSYAHADAATVYLEIARWHQQGFRIWYDEGIDPGNEWPQAIAKALGRCAQFVVFISPRAVESKNVRNEINFAVNRDKPFLAIHLEETCLPEGLELRLADIQAILKWRMSDDRYLRQLEKSLPDALR